MMTIRGEIFVFFNFALYFPIVLDVLCVHRSSDGVNKDPGGVPGELYPPPCVCIWAGSHLPQDREIW